MQSGHLVDVGGDTAVCTANVLGFHAPAQPVGPPSRRVGGFYRFELERGPAGWRVSDWSFTVSWAEGEQPPDPAS